MTTEQSVPATVHRLREIIYLFENRDDSKAYSALAATDFGVISEDLSSPHGLNGSGRILSQLQAATEKRFWVSICDLLEYELIPLLENPFIQGGTQ